MHLGEGWFDVPCYLDFMWICERGPYNYSVVERQSAVENGRTNDDQTLNFQQPYKQVWIQAIYDMYREMNDDRQTNQAEEDEQNSEQTDGQMEVSDESSGKDAEGGMNGEADTENITKEDVVTTGNDGDPDITTQSFMATMENWELVSITLSFLYFSYFI